MDAVTYPDAAIIHDLITPRGSAFVFHLAGADECRDRGVAFNVERGAVTGDGRGQVVGIYSIYSIYSSNNFKILAQLLIRVHGDAAIGRAKYLAKGNREGVRLLSVMDKLGKEDGHAR